MSITSLYDLDLTEDERLTNRMKMVISSTFYTLTVYVASLPELMEDSFYDYSGSERPAGFLINIDHHLLYDKEISLFDGQCKIEKTGIISSRGKTLPGIPLPQKPWSSEPTTDTIKNVYLKSLMADRLSLEIDNDVNIYGFLLIALSVCLSKTVSPIVKDGYIHNCIVLLSMKGEAMDFSKKKTNSFDVLIDYHIELINDAIPLVYKKEPCKTLDAATAWYAICTFICSSIDSNQLVEEQKYVCETRTPGCSSSVNWKESLKDVPPVFVDRAPR